MEIKELVEIIGNDNRENGWHDRYENLRLAADDDGMREHIASKLALVGCEVSEAIEELRRPGSFDHVMASYVGHGGKPEGVLVEVADAIIRLLDLCAMLNIDIEAVMVNKLAFNRTRGKMYGKAM